jgi:hypothetical protein
MQTKKRVQINHQPLLLTDGSAALNNENTLKSTATKSQVFEPHNSQKVFIRDDEFILLGPQDKCSSTNVAYPLRNPVRKTFVEREKSEEKIFVKKSEDVENGPKEKIDSMTYKLKKAKPTINKSKKLIKSPSKQKTEIIQKVKF